MLVERFVVGPMGNNTYVVYEERSREAAVVDPSMQAEPALEWVRAQGLTVRYVLNTQARCGKEQWSRYLGPSNSVSRGKSELKK